MDPFHITTAPGPVWVSFDVFLNYVYMHVMSHAPMKKGDLDPANVTACTCANLRKATRAVTQFYDEALRPTGLKSTQFTVLATLERYDGVPLSRLAAILVMDRTTLTRNLKPLMSDNLISIDRDNDQRVRRICLAPRGRKLLENAECHWQDAQSRMVNTIGDKRWRQLIEILSMATAAASDD